jgi:DNA-binding transcriptional MocR family regulator
MSNDAISWAWKVPAGKAKLVLIALADHGTDHCGGDWTCFPSVQRLIERTELDRSTIERHLRWLDAEGYLSRQRRVRPDGRLGIFDYTLHRDPETRARLKAERAKPASDDGAPQGNLPCGAGAGPAGDLHETSGQFAPKPQGKLPAQEPSVEPSIEPSLRARAREPGDLGFGEALAAWPVTGRKRTRLAAGRAAWARACQVETPQRLMAAIRACAADPDLAKGDYGFPALDGWLAEDRWRMFLPGEAAAGGPAPWGGPAEVADLVSQAGAGVWLAGAGWRAADRTILTRSGMGAERLAQALGAARLAALDLRVERMSSA